MTAPLNFDQIVATPAGQGPPGPPGPIAGTVANPAALSALSTSGFLFGTTYSVTSLQALFFYDPFSVAIPDNISVIAAQGGGNWINFFSLVVPSPLGVATRGTSSFIEDGADWATVAAGQTATIYTMPAPQLGFGEQVSVGAMIDVQSNAPAINVTGCTGSGVNAVVTLSNVVGLATGDRVFISGATGNTAINGGFYYSVSGSTIALFSDAALSVPIVGNGAYVSGGVVQSLGFGHFERRVTFRERHGVVDTAQATTTDTDVTTPAPPTGNLTPSMVGTAAFLAVIAGSLVVRVTAPSGFSVRGVPSGVSFARHPIPGAGPVPVVNQPATNSGSASGGTVFTISGSHFTGAVQVTLAGVPASFFLDPQTPDTLIHVTSAPEPGGTGGSGDISVTNANGTGFVGSPTAWTYVADPLSIFGANLRFFGDGSTLVQGSNVVSSWHDKSGNNQHIPVTGGTPVYNASSASITPPGPTMTTNGTTDALTLAGFAQAASGSPGVFIYAILKATNTNVGVASYTTGVVASIGQSGGTAGHPTLSAVVGVVQATVDIRGSMLAVAWYTDGGPAAAPNQNENVTVSNGSLGTLTGTAGSGTSATGTLTVAYEPNFSTHVAAEWAALIIANVKPSAGQLTALEGWAQRTYGVP